MRILIIEQCLSYNYFLKQYLEKEYFVVEHVETEEEGLDLARTNSYDLAILDTNFWEEIESGNCFRTLRIVQPSLPIVILSPSCDSSIKVAYFEAGADDFITKPFCVEELTARVRAILRRPKPIIQDIITVDDLTLHSSTHTVMRGNRVLSLTKKEFMLLELLLRNKGKIIPREKIFEHVWDIHADPFSNTFDTHLVSLRKKIENKSKKRLIHTVTGKGYKISLDK